MNSFHLSSQRYSICWRRERGFCSLCLAIGYFGLSNVPSIANAPSATPWSKKAGGYSRDGEPLTVTLLARHDGLHLLLRGHPLLQLCQLRGQRLHRDRGRQGAAHRRLRRGEGRGRQQVSYHQTSDLSPFVTKTNLLLNCCQVLWTLAGHRRPLHQHPSLHLQRGQCRQDSVHTRWRQSECRSCVMLPVCSCPLQDERDVQ